MLKRCASSGVCIDMNKHKDGISSLSPGKFEAEWGS